MAARETNKAVFLDRDGVLNRAVVRNGRPFPPSSIEEVEIIPGSAEACAAIHDAGALVFCITNQPDVARGVVRREQVAAINWRLQTALGLDEVVACYHDDADDCGCRKPKPGMLADLASRYAVDLRASVMIGDRWRDIEAGKRAGCRTVFVDHGYEEDQPAAADLACRSLAEALPWILNFLKAGRP
jgi:D-glycero-D-manno-heptose 1,7-bisphosphate phosphatase